MLHYAIADVGFFVGAATRSTLEAWRRGVTVYTTAKPVSLSARAPRAPPACCPVAAAGEWCSRARRPDGEVQLDGVERASSRAAPSWPTMTSVARTCRPISPSWPPHRAAEERRGAPTVGVPRTGPRRTIDGLAAALRPRLDIEDAQRRDVPRHQPRPWPLCSPTPLEPDCSASCPNRMPGVKIRGCATRRGLRARVASCQSLAEFERSLPPEAPQRRRS